MCILCSGLRACSICARGIWFLLIRPTASSGAILTLLSQSLIVSPGLEGWLDTLVKFAESQGIPVGTQAWDKLKSIALALLRSHPHAHSCSR